MIFRPSPQAEWLLNDLERNAHLMLLDIAHATRCWFETGGDVRGWMDAFQRLRLDILRMVWFHVIPEMYRESVQYIRLGSSARNEDLIGSDLDFAIITDNSAVAIDILPDLHRFVQTMERCGFPACQGMVTGINPRWRGPLEEWLDRTESYFAFPDWTSARYLFILLDGLPLNGENRAWTSLSSRVFEGVRSSPFMCWEMAHLGIHNTVFKPPRKHWWGNQKESINTFPAKTGLLTPIIHAIRLFAVHHGCTALSTCDRLAALESSGVLSSAFVQSIQAALEYGWKQRIYQAVGIVEHESLQHVSTHVQTAKALERLVHQKFRKPR